MLTCCLGERDFRVIFSWVCQSNDRTSYLKIKTTRMYIYRPLIMYIPGFNRQFYLILFFLEGGGGIRLCWNENCMMRRWMTRFRKFVEWNKKVIGSCAMHVSTSPTPSPKLCTALNELYIPHEPEYSSLQKFTLRSRPSPVSVISVQKIWDLQPLLTGLELCVPRN